MKEILLRLRVQHIIKLVYFHNFLPSSNFLQSKTLLKLLVFLHEAHNLLPLPAYFVFFLRMRLFAHLWRLGYRSNLLLIHSWLHLQMEVGAVFISRCMGVPQPFNSDNGVVLVHVVAPVETFAVLLFNRCTFSLSILRSLRFLNSLESCVIRVAFRIIFRFLFLFDVLDEGAE